MDYNRLLKKLDGFRQRNSENHRYLNKDVYRILYTPELYIIAYNSIKSNDGAETKGADNISLDGFCMEWVKDIISSLRNESYRPRPNTTRLIPKKNGKMRKLGYPNGKDKLVQEAVRMILECIYEPTFSDFSHGFRPGRSIHTALSQVNDWTGTAWFVEGDIFACFDEIDHGILIDILRERIVDERFLNLIRKLLNAGYFDMEHVFHKTTEGAPQGSLCSPILCNIYLDSLDRYMEDVIRRETKGEYRKQNPAYAKVLYEMKKIAKSERTPENRRKYRELLKQKKAMKSVDMFDKNFVRVKYVRYADDFLIGVIGSKKLCESIKSELQEFLATNLHLRLSMEKTKITHAHSNHADFLGYHIACGSRNPRDNLIHIFVNMDMKIKSLSSKGMCKGNGYPITMNKMLRENVQDIVKHGSSILRGMINSNEGCLNFHKMWRIQYIIQFSVAKTIAKKLDISTKQVFKKYGKNLCVHWVDERGKPRETKLAFFKSLHFDRTFFPMRKKTLLEKKKPVFKTVNPLSRKCYICGNPQTIHMYHRKSIRKLKPPYTPLVTRMIQINRRQIPLCEECFHKEHSSGFEQNQLPKRKSH